MTGETRLPPGCPMARVHQIWPGVGRSDGWRQMG